MLIERIACDGWTTQGKPCKRVPNNRVVSDTGSLQVCNAHLRYAIQAVQREETKNEKKPEITIW